MVSTAISLDEPVVIIKPQPRQEQFLASPADITIYGGAAFGGKTYALLIEPLRHISNPNFGAVVFRRTVPEITHEGGLWDEANKMYPNFGGTPNNSEHFYRFESGSRITFAHMQHDTSKYAWKSAQIPLIEFDQLETFEASQFFYMLSRNRSTCGVRPYIRATCNPEPGWLADFLSWWIGEDGYAIPERSGIMRYMVRENDVTHWGDNYHELAVQYPNSTPKSVTFILATIYDNKIGMDLDPNYIANLQALSYVDRERLLGDVKRGGNWKVKPSAGKIFNRDWFNYVDNVPFGLKYVRFWDLAATAPKMIGVKKKSDPDYTACVKMAKDGAFYYIVHVYQEQIEPAKTNTLIKSLAGIDDSRYTRIRWEQEGGASGVRDSYNIVTFLNGYDAKGVHPTKDKIARATPLAAQVLAGNVKLLRASWNEMFINHMHSQPDYPHDDLMDAASGAYNELIHGDGSMEFTIS